MTETKLREAIRHHLSLVLEYDPFGRFEGVTDKEGFVNLLSGDPAFAPFFLDNPKYVTARIGGNLITSLHRKLGDMYQDAFRILLADKLHISEEDLFYSIELDIDGELQERSTDGLIHYSRLLSTEAGRIKSLGKTASSDGMAFEVRSCYQIGDSKRIQADRDMAIALKKQKNLEPVMIIFCASSLTSPVRRLRKYWHIYEGNAAFEFVEQLTQFNLYGFFRGERNMIHGLMIKIFEMM